MNKNYSANVLSDVNYDRHFQTCLCPPTKSFVIITVVLSILTMIIIIFTIVVAVERNRNSITRKIAVDDQNLCMTPACIKAANYLLESIDETVKPCENFFQFVCGTWLRNNRIPDDDAILHTFQELQTQLENNIVALLSSPTLNTTAEPRAVINAGRLYNSCVNADAIETNNIDTILSWINFEIGGWPILQGSLWNNSILSLSDRLLKLSKYDTNLFYSVTTDIDDENSSIYSIKIGQSSLGLEDRSHYTHETDVTIAYRQFMRNLALTLTNITSMIDDDVNDIFEFEKTIATYHWTRSERRARRNETVRTTIGNLSIVFNTSFNWTDHLYRIYFLLGNVSLVDTDIVSIRELEYLRNVSSTIDQYPSRTIQNYMVWRFMMNQIHLMPKKFRNIKEEFDRIFQGTSSQRPHTIVCATYVNDNMPFAVAKLYMGKYFDHNARNQSLEMIDNILNTFIDMIEQSTWMDDISKKRAVEKARVIDKKVGYPDYLITGNLAKLDQDYAEYNFNSSFIHNLLIVLQLKAKTKFGILRTPVDRRAWGDAVPIVVNAFFKAQSNRITFPAGIFQMPLFHKDVPKYLNYGGIGVVIGHEITHLFDDFGRQYDKDGNKIQWWTAGTISEFVKRKRCIIDQYSNYTLNQINLSVNGNLTQGENIADNGGLKGAFLAYQRWVRTNRYAADKALPGLQKYSSEQMFFINSARLLCSKTMDSFAKNMILLDEHSPEQFRVLGQTSNFVEFDRVFSCKPGQDNSRINKCVVW